MFAWRFLCVLLCLWMTRADNSCPGLPKCFCSKDKTSVNCEGKHFTSLPDGIPDTATKLYLGHNDFTEIQTNEFSRLYKLEQIWLNNNKITSIKPNAFNNLSALSHIDLKENKLQAIGKKSFANMPRLNVLYLTTNQISSFDEGAFSDTTALQSLYLQSNRLTAIPPLGNLPILQKLILDGNTILNATFPESFTTCKRLSNIVLSNNNIKLLTDDTFLALSNNTISSLYLTRNKISKVEPKSFHPLASIASLKLGYNPLDSAGLKTALEGLQGKSMVSLDISSMQLNGILLQDTFALLKNTTITTLNMRYNKIRILPNMSFSGLSYLLHLDISSCGIQSTSSMSFYGLDKLTVLNMNDNKLTEIPRNFPASLTYLSLDYNGIETIGSKIFLNLGQLQELRIRFNKLRDLEEDSFLGLFSLRKLKLYNNIIANLPKKLFQPLVRLISLDLSKNNLKSIQYSPDRFSSQSSLIYLSFTDNGCFAFQPDLLNNLTSLKYLHLERNQLGAMITEDYGGKLFKGMTKLEELYLMDNGLTAIPDPMFQDLGSLAVLNISSNKLAGWGANLFKTSTKLETLDLSFNLITTVKQDSVAGFSSLKSWNLTGNPFSCNCDLRWFRDWLNKTSVTFANVDTYTCNGPPDWAGKRLLSFDRTKINCQHFTLKIIIISCSVVAVIVIIIGILMYSRRWHMKLMCYKMRRTTGNKRRAPDGRGRYGAIPEERKNFDAYISCAEEDREWVIRNLLPGIDNGKLDDDHQFGGDFSMYFDPRDSIPGEPIVGNIFENMLVSRKVIVVLSQNFLTDRMHMFELDLAIDEMYGNRLEEIIVVHIDKGLPDRKIPRYLLKTMKRHQMIEWSPDENAQQLFRHTLADRLAVKANAAEIDAE